MSSTTTLTQPLPHPLACIARKAPRLSSSMRANFLQLSSRTAYSPSPVSHMCRAKHQRVQDVDAVAPSLPTSDPAYHNTMTLRNFPRRIKPAPMSVHTHAQTQIIDSRSPGRKPTPHCTTCTTTHHLITSQSRRPAIVWCPFARRIRSHSRRRHGAHQPQAVEQWPWSAIGGKQEDQTHS